MVKIAVAGGSGQIAKEVIDVLVATNKHDILIFSRKDHVATESTPGITWVKADYRDKPQLTNALSGVHTVISFINAPEDVDSASQKSLIDAAVAAGVKRFAPSEWSSSKFDELPWYTEKLNVRTYLENVNKEKKVLEYTLFQSGILLDYFAPVGASAKHIKPTEFLIDLLHRRALIIDGQESIFTFTTVNDLANVVARAIEYDGEWPVDGGINGNSLSSSEFIEIGARVRGGKPFDVTALKEEDVRAGNIHSSWIPKIVHPSIPPEKIDSISKVILIGSLLSGIRECWAVSDKWNQLLPDYKFTDAEEFLSKHWAGRP